MTSLGSSVGASASMRKMKRANRGSAARERGEDEEEGPPPAALLGARWPLAPRAATRAGGAEFGRLVRL